MKDYIDLHIHTHYSNDGDYSPEKIVQMAKEIGLKAIALSDHDSVEAIPEGLEAGEHYGIEVIPAVELSLVENGEDLHMLGYFIDYQNQDLLAVLKKLNQDRWEQLEKRIIIFRDKIGFALNREDIAGIDGKAPPLAPSLARAILDNPKNREDKRLQIYYTGERSGPKCYINFVKNYFLLGQPASVRKAEYTPKEAIKLLAKIGALSVVAHPGAWLKDEIIYNIAPFGLNGLEIYSTYHNAEQIKHYENIAEELKLLKTAGSDFHGPSVKPHIKLGGIENNTYDLLEALKKAL